MELNHVTENEVVVSDEATENSDATFEVEAKGDWKQTLMDVGLCGLTFVGGVNVCKFVYKKAIKPGFNWAKAKFQAAKEAKAEKAATQPTETEEVEK